MALRELRETEPELSASGDGSDSETPTDPTPEAGGWNATQNSCKDLSLMKMTAETMGQINLLYQGAGEEQCKSGG